MLLLEGRQAGTTTHRCPSPIWDNWRQGDGHRRDHALPGSCHRILQTPSTRRLSEKTASQPGKTESESESEREREIERESGWEWVVVVGGGGGWRDIIWKMIPKTVTS